MIGNCQADVVAEAMRLMLPDAAVTFETIHGIGRRHRRMSDLVRAYEGCDVVFANRIAPPFATFPDGDFETFRAATRLFQIPVVVFAALHPDVVYVGHERTGAFLSNVLGPQHSAIALYAFQVGFTIEEVIRLYGEPAFRRLGYLDGWEAAMGGLIALGQEAGHDLASAALRWTRRGAFMHSIEHPHLHVIADIARSLLDRAGIPHPDLDLESVCQDRMLVQGMWPVYPEIGAAYGVGGAYLFRGRGRSRADPPPVLGLRAFVEASIQAYAALPLAALEHPRVTTWLADRDLGRDLARIAGRP